LKGTIINFHVRGEYLDHKKYWVIFESADKLGIQISDIDKKKIYHLNAENLLSL